MLGHLNLSWKYKAYYVIMLMEHWMKLVRYFHIIFTNVLLLFLYTVDSYMFCFIWLLPEIAGHGLKSSTGQDKRHSLEGLSVQGASLYVVHSGGFSSEICDWGWRRWEVRWVRRFETMKRSSDDPQTRNHFISIYQFLQSLTDWLTDWTMLSTIPPLPALGGYLLFTLSTFQRNNFSRWCALCMTQLWRTLTYLSQIPHYSLGKHKNVILNSRN